MQSTSLVIAAGVAAIYTLFGPLVLLGIYIFLTRLAEGGSRNKPRKKPRPEEKDPAVWTPDDSRQYLKDRRFGLFRPSGNGSGHRSDGRA